jgi:hypothetical protein
MDAQDEGGDVRGEGAVAGDQMGEGAEAGNQFGEYERLNAWGNPKLTKSGAVHIEIVSGSTNLVSSLFNR